MIHKDLAFYDSQCLISTIVYCLTLETDSNKNKEETGEEKSLGKLKEVI